MFSTRTAGAGRYFLIALFVCGISLGLVPSKAHAAYIGWFDYGRNGTNTNGTLSWQFTLNDNPPVHTVSWRAGSGKELNDHLNVGWLPSGWYSVRGHWNDYYGTKIWGRVWYLSDKYNEHSVKRTALFIHTEETRANGQSATYEPQRWDGVSDYLSEGCVKIAYGSDLDNMHLYWNNYGGGTEHGNGSPYPLASKLYVHN